MRKPLVNDWPLKLSGGLLVALVSAPFVGAIDLLIMVGAGQGGTVEPAAFPLALSLITFVGSLGLLALALPVSAVLEASARLGTRRVRQLALVTALGMPFLALMAALLFDAFPTITDLHLRSSLFVAAAVLVGGMCLVGGWSAFDALDAWVLRRGGSLAPCWVASALVLFLSGFVLYLWMLFHRLLPAAAWLAGFGFFLLLAAGWLLASSLVAPVGRLARDLLANRRFRLVLWIIPVLCLLLGQAITSWDDGPSSYLVARGGLSGHLLVRMRGALDLDGDGTPWVLGGGDCDDFDGRRHPLALDIPGNGFDEDCDGIDRVEPEIAEEPSPYMGGESPEAPFNVILICVDALRSDHVGFGGYHRPTTPKLDELAARSWVFENAIAPSSTTRETIPSLVTGRYPSGIHWKKGPQINQLGSAENVLPQLLKKKGYRTVGLVDEWLRRFLPSFRRGFDRFEVPYGTLKWHKFGQIAAPYTTFRAIQVLAEHNSRKPLFLYLQYEAPHHPYVGHEGITWFGERPVDLYDHEIAFADHYIGVLLDYLLYAKLMERTIIIVFGDHGEEFHEHGGERHSRTVHRESVHVALLVHVPGTQPARIRERVSLVDVFPTILDLTGFQKEGKETQGISLLRTVSEGSGPLLRPIYSELMVNHEGPNKYRKAIYLGNHKLMWDMASNEVLLFDVRSDPWEERPLDLPRVRADLFRRLKTFVSQGNHK